MAKKKKPKQPTSRIDVFTQRINTWSRPSRIAVSSFVTLMVLVIVFLLMDQLLLDKVDNEELSIWVPTIIIAAAGTVTYGIGWFLLVGFDWDVDKPWRARRASTYFVMVGLLGLLLGILGLLRLLALTYF